MSAEKSLVTVIIAGEEYALRSEATPEYTRECARYLDNTISDIRRQARMIEPHKAAILAALSIVDQYFKASRELDGVRANSEAAAGRLAAEIEAHLAAFDLASPE